MKMYFKISLKLAIEFDGDTFLIFFIFPIQKMSANTSKVEKTINGIRKLCNFSLFPRSSYRCFYLRLLFTFKTLNS